LRDEEEEEDYDERSGDEIEIENAIEK